MGRKPRGEGDDNRIEGTEANVEGNSAMCEELLRNENQRELGEVEKEKLSEVKKTFERERNWKTERKILRSKENLKSRNFVRYFS